MPGERRLIIGPNGAGKTTLFNLVTGDLTPDTGSVKLFGQELLKLPTQQRVHLGLARTYQILTLFPKETLVPQRRAGAARPRQAALEPVDVSLSGQRHLYDAAREALTLVGPRRERGPHRRGDLLWRAAPARNGDGAGAEAEGAAARRAARRDFRRRSAARCASCSARVPRDVTIVMIEHDMDSALAFAERITLLHYGEVIVEGTRAEVVADPRTKEVYLGE